MYNSFNHKSAHRRYGAVGIGLRLDCQVSCNAGFDSALHYIQIIFT